MLINLSDVLSEQHKTVDETVQDEVVLIGKSGEEEITVEELSELSGRFNYEFVCCLGKRIPRVYKGGNL